MCIRDSNPDFSVFSAYENQAMGLLVCGVDGFINATANFAPEYTVNTYQSAKRGDFNEAAKWFNKMVEAMDIYAYSTPLFLACKQAMYYSCLLYTSSYADDANDKDNQHFYQLIKN